MLNLSTKALFLENPVFISGFNKSGTTLLLSLFDHAPQLIVIPEELHFFQNAIFAKSKSIAITEKTGFKIFIQNEYLKSWSQGKSWFKDGYPEFNKKGFGKMVGNICSTTDEPRIMLLKLIYAFAVADGADIEKKKWWVTKTTQNEIFFPLMQRMFNHALRFIYLVRDPRDVYGSYMRRKSILKSARKARLRDATVFAANWKIQVNKAIHYNRTCENFRLVRYEDLVMDTKEVMETITRELNISFSDILLQPTRHGKPWAGNSVFTDDFKGISKEPIGRYKKISIQA